MVLFGKSLTDKYQQSLAPEEILEPNESMRPNEVDVEASPVSPAAKTGRDASVPPSSIQLWARLESVAHGTSRTTNVRARNDYMHGQKGSGWRWPCYLAGVCDRRLV